MTAVQFRNTDVRLSEALHATALAIDGEHVTLRRLLEIVGEQGLLVFCAILGMPFMLPVTIPFMSTVLGTPMLLIGIAVVLNRVPWLPNRLLDHALPAEPVRHVLGHASRTAERFEHLVKPRLLALTATVTLNSVHGLAMVLGRFVPIILVLALAGSLAAQGRTPESIGTLPTHRPQFVGMVAGVTLILVALTFLPMLALGPLAEGIH